MRVFVDTSAWFAFANHGDRNHAAVAKALQQTGVRPVTSNWVCWETVTLVRAKGGHPAAVRVGEHLRSGAIEVVHITATDEEAAWRLFRERPDKRYSLVDCTSFVAMQQLGLGQALTFDDDFRKEGFQVKP